MSNRIQLNFGGREVWGELIPVQEAKEAWNNYLLTDGSVVKVKIVVTDIFRLENEYDPEGNPVYFLKSAQVLSVNAPEQLKRKK